MKQVLIAEDDVYLRDAYITILETAGYQVQGVENGQEALKSIQSSLPDVLLLDMLMPVMGGLELLDELTAKGLKEKIKVIAFTNLSDKETIDKLQVFGVEKYLLKSSVMPAQLIATIEEVVSEGVHS